jgi:hypothetical protein
MQRARSRLRDGIGSQGMRDAIGDYDVCEDVSMKKTK